MSTMQGSRAAIRSEHHTHTHRHRIRTQNVGRPKHHSHKHSLPLRALVAGETGLDLGVPPPPQPADFPGPFRAPRGEADLGDEARRCSGDAPLPPPVTGEMDRDPWGREGGEKAPTPSPAARRSLKISRAKSSRSWMMSLAVALKYEEAFLVRGREVGERSSIRWYGSKILCLV